MIYKIDNVSRFVKAVKVAVSITRAHIGLMKKVFVKKKCMNK